VTLNAVTDSYGGVAGGSACNSVVWNNTADTSYPNWYNTSFANSCTTPLPSGTDNFSSDPLFISFTDFHISNLSPCVDGGENSCVTVLDDLDGNLRITDGDADVAHSSIVDLGCYERPNFTYVWYVSPASSADGPGTLWSNAFHTIQGAIDAASDNESVLVSNGVYDTGTTYREGIRARVNVDKQITVRAVNGPEQTIIEGDGPNGSSAVRCVYLGENALLSGFTITNGHTDISGDESDWQSGGGAWCESSSLISNCIIVANSANVNGGGVMGGNIADCTLQNNTAQYGGGAALVMMTNCVVSGNTAEYGGGIYRYRAYSSLFSDNTATNGGGGYSATMDNCRVIDNTATGNGGGGYQISAESSLFSGNSASDGGATYQSSQNNSTITANSATVRGGGTSYGSIYNCIVWDNTAPLNPNFYSGSMRYTCTTPLPSGAGNIEQDPLFVEDSNYHISPLSPCVESGDNQYVYRASDLNGATRIVDSDDDSSAIVDMGCYEIDVVRVDAASAVDGPGSAWSNAYTTIQGAVDAAAEYSLVLVNNGLYASGGAVVNDSLKSRVAITKPLTVKSVNGPHLTTIQGVGPNGKAAVRGVYLADNATLIGFTVSNGHTRNSGTQIFEQSGGAILNLGEVYNCIIAGNAAEYSGGGVAAGSVYNSLIQNNTAAYGGGAGVNCSLYNCTVNGNSGSIKSGGVNLCTLRNSIVWGNTTDGTDPNWYSSSFNYCCTTPLPVNGMGNISSDPQFVAATDLHLNSASPALDSGYLGYQSELVDSDIDQNPRVLASDVSGSAQIDMGAYEYLNINADSDGDGMPDGWELDYGFNPVSDLDAATNADGDSFNNGQEYLADTDPGDSSSFFTITAVTHSAQLSIHFKSSADRNYTLMSCTNLLNDTWQNVPLRGPRAGEVDGDDSMLVTPDQPHEFYKIKVELP